MVHALTPQGQAMPARSSRPGRPMWHWLVVGGVALLGLLVVGIFAVFIAFQLLTRGNPQSTLEDFYSSLENTDCELFMESTTEDFRERTGLTSCAIFEEQVGSVSAVDYEVDDRINRQGYAIFEVTESYSFEGSDVDVSLRYYVRRTDGEWGLDGIDVLEPGAEPIT